jgi:hypothetical protein
MFDRVWKQNQKRQRLAEQKLLSAQSLRSWFCTQSTVSLGGNRLLVVSLEQHPSEHVFAPT